MPKYRVYLETTASVGVEVEADDEDQAIEAAYNEAPSPVFGWPDMGDWEFPPDIDSKLVRANYITKETDDE